MRNRMPVSKLQSDWQAISPYHLRLQCLQQIKPWMKINYPT